MSKGARIAVIAVIIIAVAISAGIAAFVSATPSTSSSENTHISTTGGAKNYVIGLNESLKVGEKH